MMLNHQSARGQTGGRRGNKEAFKNKENQMQLFRCLSGVSSVLNYTLFYCNEAWGWALHPGEFNFSISKSI